MGAAYADPSHLHLLIQGEHFRHREIVRLRVADAGEGADAPRLRAMGRGNEAPYPLPPSMLGPDPVFQLGGRAVV